MVASTFLNAVHSTCAHSVSRHVAVCREQSENPLFRRLSESARRDLLVREADHRTDLAQMNLHEAAELTQIRTSRDFVGCNCHPVSQDIKKFSQKRIKQELLLRGVSAAKPTGVC